MSRKRFFMRRPICIHADLTERHGAMRSIPRPTHFFKMVIVVPGQRTGEPSRANMVPATVMLVGENFGGAIENSGAVVGVAEFEGLNAETYNFYDDTGAHYCMADGSVAFMSKTEATRYRADTDYNGDPRDPWKWVP